MNKEIRVALSADWSAELAAAIHRSNDASPYSLSGEAIDALGLSRRIAWAPLKIELRPGHEITGTFLGKPIPAPPPSNNK